jgi:hypothetical protein
MNGELDTRLLRLKAELDDHARIARHLGLDFERPIQSLGDAYPGNAIAWVGKLDHLCSRRRLRPEPRHCTCPACALGPAEKRISNHRRATLPVIE